MPVIVIGADTPVGEAIVTAVLPSAAEMRAFVSDERSAESLKSRGVKVALGDVSDFSHVEAAALNCFCAVLVVDAATDERERAFAGNPREMVEGWGRAVREAGVHRTIWVSAPVSPVPFPAPTPEVATVAVGTDLDQAMADVVRLEGLYSLPARPDRSVAESIDLPAIRLDD